MEEAKADLENLLKVMVEREASDVYFRVGAPPYLRICGQISPHGDTDLTKEDLREMAYCVMSEEQRMKFEQDLEMDLAYSVSGLGRFRVNIFFQRGTMGMVLRSIKFKIPSFEDLNLPQEVLARLAMESRGLVLVTGTAGSGKSTTIACMIDYINENKGVHVVTIEDPIEFVFKDKKSIITQREIGMDTYTFTEALRHVIRQAPDVIFIGEMRDVETMQAALMAAETGHLVLSTLHTMNAVQTVERIMNFFPPYQHQEIKLQLSLLLKGVISLRLLSRKDGRGRMPALETMLLTPRIAQLIREGNITQLLPTIEDGTLFGMQTFNQSLTKLYKEGYITLEEAMGNADSRDDLSLSIKDIRSGKSP